MPANQDKHPTANEEKPTLKLRAQADAEEAAMAAKIKAAEEASKLAAEAVGDKNVEPEEFVSIAGLAAQGREKLLDALRAHADKPKPVYVPPPMTERQLSAREQELEAGRRAVKKAEEQLALRPQPVANPKTEGFTTPAHRPNNMVPDPVTGKLGLITPDA